MKYKFYSVDNNFKPNWDELERLVCPKTEAILMVHYFGQPQNINKFKLFCDNHKIFLIEDNAHGFGGKFNGNYLGTYGDIGISSPRKILNNVYTGGILYTKNNNVDYSLELDHFSVSKIKKLKVFLQNSLKNEVRLISKIIRNRPKYEDPKAFREIILPDFSIDKISKEIIINTDLEKLRNSRQAKYYEFKEFALQNNLAPAIKNLNIEASPWCFPVYVKSKDEAIKWFNWGWNKRIRVFSWPSLPKEILINYQSIVKRWEKLICFEI